MRVQSCVFLFTESSVGNERQTGRVFLLGETVLSANLLA